MLGLSHGYLQLHVAFHLSHGSGNLLGLADDVPGVNDTRDPGETAKEDVDQEVSATATLHEDGHERHEDGQEVEKNIASV